MKEEEEEAFEIRRKATPNLWLSWFLLQPIASAIQPQHSTPPPPPPSSFIYGVGPQAISHGLLWKTSTQEHYHLRMAYLNPLPTSSKHNILNPNALLPTIPSASKPLQGILNQPTTLPSALEPLQEILNSQSTNPPPPPETHPHFVPTDDFPSLDHKTFRHM